MHNKKQKLAEFIKKKNLKWSKQRECIVDLFMSTDTHVTTEQLYQEAIKHFPQIGYTTVHRTLKMLTECGLAKEIKFNDPYTRFEKAVEKSHHDHLICTACGSIIEFKCEEIENQQIKVAQHHEFTITRHSLQLYGICSKCNELQKKG